MAKTGCTLFDDDGDDDDDDDDDDIDEEAEEEEEEEEDLFPNALCFTEKKSILLYLGSADL